MLKYRLFSFFTLICLLGVLFYLDFTHTEWGRIFFTVLAALAAIPASFELTKILQKAGVSCWNFLFPGVFCAAALFFAAFVQCGTGVGESIFIIGSIFVMFQWSCLLTSGVKSNACNKNSGSSMVFIFIAILVFSLWRIHEAGPEWFLFFVAATKACDTGGYITGMLSNKMMKNGNHKLIPSISPKKSWEGLGGGILLSLAIGYVFCINDSLHIGTAATLVTAFLLCLGSLAGDLSESALKRKADVKDSGNWIPGMGGILDVVDSFIYNGPVLALILTTTGK